MKPSRDKRRDNRPPSRAATADARPLRPEREQRSAGREARVEPGRSPNPRRARLRRREGALPAERLPVILEVAPNADYALIDSGDGQKLEQYGPYRIVRPEGQAIWQKALAGARMGQAPTPSSPATPTRKGWAAGVSRRTPLGETWPMQP